MTARTAAAILAPGASRVVDAEVPAWVAERFDRWAGWSPLAECLEVRRIEGDGLALYSLRHAGAVGLDEGAFAACASRLYDLVCEQLRSSAHHLPIRLWNFIPGILAPLGELRHRYMAFNAGRFEAYLRWFGGREELARRVPTASGVGHRGDQLVVHCLAAEGGGVPVENPLQVASYRYSARYGSPPPSFARATRVDGEPPLLLVGGTASIRGEDSTHRGRLEAQLEHTFENLAALVDAGRRRPIGCPRRALGCFRAVRVYYVDPLDLPVIRQRVEGELGHVGSVEYVEADLCRPELLVEIEGVAELDG